MQRLIENWRQYINENKFKPYYILFDKENGVTEKVVKEISLEILGIGNEFKSDSKGAEITATDKGLKKLIDAFTKNKLQISNILQRDKKTPVAAA